MKTKNIIVALMVTALAFSGCKKGDTGAAGPAGINGTNGTTGTNGTNGATGATGNANVTSLSLTSSPSNWTHIGTAGQNDDGYMVTFSVPQLTSSIITNGAVLMYYQNGGSIAGMPLSFSAYQNITSTLSFDAQAGVVNAYLKDSDFNTLAPAANLDFKLVLMSGYKIKHDPSINWKNYSEVKTRFNLQE